MSFTVIVVFVQLFGHAILGIVAHGRYMDKWFNFIKPFVVYEIRVAGKR